MTQGKGNFGFQRSRERKCISKRGENKNWPQIFFKVDTEICQSGPELFQRGPETFVFH